MICKLIYNESLSYHPEEKVESPKKKASEKSGDSPSPQKSKPVGEEITELPVKNPEPEKESE